MQQAAETGSQGTARGLNNEESARRLMEQGRNEIAREKATSPWVLLVGQLKSPVIWLLLGASVISAILGEVADASAIGTIVVINGMVDFFQEYRSGETFVQRSEGPGATRL